MATTVAQIDIIKSQIQKTSEILDNYYKDLGKVACNYHHAIAYSPSQEVFDKLCDIVGKRDEVFTHINAVEGALSRMDASGKDIENSKLSVKNLDARFDTLVAAVGAVAVEAYEAGVLPIGIKQYMNSINEYNGRLRELEKKFEAQKDVPLFGSLTKNKIEKHKNTLSDVFYSIGKQLYSTGNIRQVPGSRAQALIDEIDSVEETKKNFKSIIKDKQNAISKAEGSLKSENKTLKELNAVYDDLSKQADLLFTQYGSVIAQGMDSWLDAQAPETIKECCHNIKTETKRLKQQNINLNFLKIQLEVDSHNIQVQQIKHQIDVLTSQANAINKQIEEFGHKLEYEQKEISSLKEKQRDLSSVDFPHLSII